MPGAETARNIAVTGAGRGLGLGLARVWIERGDRVLALVRRPAAAKALRALADARPDRLALIRCDVGSDRSVRRAAAAVEGAVDRIDLLVNNAGVYGRLDDRLETLPLDEVAGVFEVNALGPLRVTRAFLPLLRRGRGARVVHVTSLMGSIGDNGSGGSYAYRLSKAALNMASRNLAIELKPAGILSIVIHPGWVRTDMGGPNAPLTIEESVTAMARTIDSLRPEDAGGFFDRDGKPLPW